MVALSLSCEARRELSVDRLRFLLAGWTLGGNVERSKPMRIAILFLISALAVLRQNHADSETINSRQLNAAGAFTNPLNPGPDPYMAWHDGNFYLTTTQGDCIRVW